MRVVDSSIGPEGPALASLLSSLGLEAEDVPNLLEAEAYSRARIREARGLVGGVVDAKHDAVASFALGSLGRAEASEASDLDLAFVYDGARIDEASAKKMRARVREALLPRFDVPEKTFDDVIELGRLVRHVGGSDDTNRTLTYRALILTEGRWLQNSVSAQAVKSRIFSVYAAGTKTRGRFLNSLANDLHRYYRTLCVDYRFKVEEHAKSWALRVLKLRHSRKLWHLANIVTQCWAVECLDDAARDATVAERLGWPSLARIVAGMQELGELRGCAGLFRAHDRFLGAVGSELVREELESLDYAKRYDAALYRSLHYNAEQLDAAAAEVVDLLLERCRPYLIRFCLL